MSDLSNRRSSRSTISLDAAFIPEDAEGQVDRTELVANLGVAMLRLPGVLVSSGGPSPGYPYVEIGEFQQDMDVGAESLSSHGIPSTPTRSADIARQADSQHNSHVELGRGRTNDHSNGILVIDPQIDRPVAPVPGFQGSRRPGGTQDDAVAAALIASTTEPSYADLSDLVRHAVPEMRRKVSPGTRSPGDNTRDLPDDKLASTIGNEQTRVIEATPASSPSEQGVEVTLPNGRAVPDDHTITTAT